MCVPALHLVTVSGVGVLPREEGWRVDELCCTYVRTLLHCSGMLHSPDTEVARLKRNWMIVHGTSFALGLSFAISYPSLHQFVTTPRDVAPSSTVS